jgi:hypothetical protein
MALFSGDSTHGFFMQSIGLIFKIQLDPVFFRALKICVVEKYDENVTTGHIFSNFFSQTGQPKIFNPQPAHLQPLEIK